MCRRQCFVVIALIGLLGLREAAATCRPEPLAACRMATKHQFRATSDTGGPEKRLAWAWRGGPSTDIADLGDPTTDTAYWLCVYDDTDLVTDVELSAGDDCDGLPCWTEIIGRGYRYRDRTGAHGGMEKIVLKTSPKNRSRIRLSGKGLRLPDLPLPTNGAITVQLSHNSGLVCFESIFAPSTLTMNDGFAVEAELVLLPSTPFPSLPSGGCNTPLIEYPPGISTSTSIDVGGLPRTFRVHRPTSYPATNDVPAAVVLLLHGGFGSGEQIETSSRMLDVAAEEGFVVVSPDGVAGPFGVRSWNAGECCGYAQAQGIDDVGFIDTLLDHLENVLCVDRRRVYAAGMSNGAMLAHRLGCELAGRVRAVGPVAAPSAMSACTPSRPVPLLHIHGTADQHAPYDGGTGCGPSGFDFMSVAQSVDEWRQRDGCSGDATIVDHVGDALCTIANTCAAGVDVTLCSIAGGGHQWTGGNPPAILGTPNCLFGHQSLSFSASVALWGFFAQHPPH